MTRAGPPGLVRCCAQVCSGARPQRWVQRQMARGPLRTGGSARALYGRLSNSEYALKERPAHLRNDLRPLNLLVICK